MARSGPPAQRRRRPWPARDGASLVPPPSLAGAALLPPPSFAGASGGDGGRPLPFPPAAATHSLRGSSTLLSRNRAAWPRACWSLRRRRRQSSRYIHSAQPPPLPDFSRHPLPLPAPPLRPNRRRRSRPRPPRTATPAASRVSRARAPRRTAALLATPRALEPCIPPPAPSPPKILLALHLLNLHNLSKSQRDSCFSTN